MIYYDALELYSILAFHFALFALLSNDLRVTELVLTLASLFTGTDHLLSVKVMNVAS